MSLVLGTVRVTYHGGKSRSGDSNYTYDCFKMRDLKRWIDLHHQMSRGSAPPFLSRFGDWHNSFTVLRCTDSMNNYDRFEMSVCERMIHFLYQQLGVAERHDEEVNWQRRHDHVCVLRQAARRMHITSISIELEVSWGMSSGQPRPEERPRMVGSCIIGFAKQITSISF